MREMKRAVVTGGAGFIGSHVVDAYLAADYEVLVIDDLSTGKRENCELAAKEYPKTLQLAELDICAPETRARIKAFAPDIICHLAAQMDVRRSVAEPQFDAEKNIIGTINLLEAAKESGCKVFSFASTGGAIYGEQEYFPADENHPTSPESPYGISKRAAELYLEYYARTFGIHARSLRFANVFGPRQNPKGEAGVVAIFSERILAGQALAIYGDGGQTRDFVFVRDVISAFKLASDKALEVPSRKGTFKAYNIGCAVETSVNQLVQTMKEASAAVLQRPFPPIEHREGRPGEQRRSVISFSKIEGELGWKPQVSLLDGLRQTIESYL